MRRKRLYWRNSKPIYKTSLLRVLTPSRWLTNLFGPSVQARRRRRTTPKRCARRFGALSKTSCPNVAEEVRVLYGGSMKPSNAEELLAQEDIDGGLVGGASLEVDSFVPTYRGG